jgi:hypothetical protein
MLQDEQDELIRTADILIESGFDFHGQYLVPFAMRPPTTQKCALRLRGVLPLMLADRRTIKTQG